MLWIVTPRSKTALFFVACDANPDTREILNAMRIKGYSPSEAADRSLQQQERCEADKIKGEAIPGPPLLTRRYPASPPALRRLVEYATSYAAANGLQVEVKGAQGRYVSAPISLLPQSYPSYAFERAMSLSGPFGVLVDRVSRDGGFLRRTLAEARGVDEYTDMLLAM